jgi:hypothetical protein
MAQQARMQEELLRRQEESVQKQEAMRKSRQTRLIRCESSAYINLNQPL